MSISHISVHWEAFTLIVYVLFLSLTIWCRSLLITIISKSLSCVVHLCNNIFPISSSEGITYQIYPRWKPKELWSVTQKRGRKETDYKLYFKCRNALLYSVVCCWICTRGTMDKISQYFSLGTIWLSARRNYFYKAVFDSVALPWIELAKTQLLHGLWEPDVKNK